MRFQDRMGLSIEPRDAILTDMQQEQPRFENLPQQLFHEQAALRLLLEKERAELEPTLIQSVRVPQVEREMRRTHLAILIGLKDRLTSEQQAMLQEINEDQSFGEGLGSAPSRALQEQIQPSTAFRLVRLPRRCPGLRVIAYANNYCGF